MARVENQPLGGNSIAGSVEGSRHDSRRTLFLLLALLLLSRLLVAAIIWKTNSPAGFLTPDTLTYVVPAQSLWHGALERGGNPEIFRTPGYPWFLFLAAGSAHWLLIGILQNVGLAVASGWLIWRIAALIFPGGSAPAWAVLLYCFEPIGALASVKIMPDALLVFLILSALWLLLSCLQKPSYRAVLLCSLAWAAAAYTRPIALYLGPCIAVLLYVFPRDNSSAGRLRRAFVFLLAFVALVAPWFVRNAVAANYRGFSSVGDHTLYFYAAAAVNAQLEGRSFAEEQKRLGYPDFKNYFLAHPEQRSWLEARILRFQAAEARRVVASHWLLYLRIHARGCAVVLLDPGVTDVLKAVDRYPESEGLMSRIQGRGFLPSLLWLARQYPATGWLLAVMGLQLLFYYLLAIAGWRQLPTQVAITFALLFVYLVVISGFPGAVGRYRAPVMPLVAICAGAALSRRGKKRAFIDERLA